MNYETKIIQPVGILDGIQGNKLRREVLDLIQAGAKNILIDCEKIKFVDSSGLGALVTIMRSAKQVNGRFAICSINDQIKMLLELTSMNKVLAIVADHDEFLVESLVTP